MSLLTESVSTVVDGGLVYGGNVIAGEWVGPTLGRQPILQGVVSPTAIGFYPVLDLTTGLPIELPVNAVPLRMLFVPEVPLTAAAGLANVHISGAFGSNEAFAGVYQPWLLSGPPPYFEFFTGVQVNNNAVFETVNPQSSPASFALYPYVGVQVANAAVSSGKLNVYLYYYQNAVNQN